MTVGDNDIMRVEDVAVMLRVSTKTVYKMIKTRKIKAKRVGREWRILSKNVLEYLGG